MNNLERPSWSDCPTGGEGQAKQLQLQGAVLQAAANSIVVTDSQGVVSWVNPAFTRLTGYTAPEIIGRKPSLLKSGKHDLPFYQGLWKTITAGEVWHGELVNRRKDGSLYTEEMTITPVLGEAGAITHYVAIKQDVTERKHAAARLSAFSALGHRLSAAQTAKEAARIIVDVADALLGWDACSCDLYSAQEGLIRSVLDMDIVNGQRVECHPAYRQSPPTPLVKHAITEGGLLLLRQEGDPAVSNLLPFGDTGRRSASLLFVPIRNGGGVIGVLSIQSYTPNAYDQASLETLQALAGHCVGALERIRSQEELRWKTAFLEAQVDSSADGILVVDNHGRQILRNQRILDLWKLPAEMAARGDDAAELQFAAQSTRDPEQFLKKVAWLYGHPNEVSRDIIEFKDGTVLDRYSAPVVGEEGIRYGRLWTFRDITEQRRLEAQLRQSQKMEGIGQLAAGVAHDFNNLLAVIRGNSELVLMQPNQLTGQATDCLKQIIAAAERAAGLTRQLLAFGRKQFMQPQALNLAEVVGNLTRMLKRVIGEDIDLQLRYGGHLPLVMADTGMVEQVLLNLVVNARDAMPSGGRLLVSTEAVRLTVADVPAHLEARPGEFACLTVADNGIGIAPEHLPHIFEPFYTTKDVGKGSGLGLATVYGIVKQHAGWVEVSSQPGAGSKFRVFLPATETPAAGAVDSPESKPPGGRETIFLVEDDEAVRRLTRRLLESSGYRVREGRSGREALEIGPDALAEVSLLLTDLVMPNGISGRELAEQLRIQRPDLKVVFMSGYGGAALGTDTGFLRRLGSRFLPKPCPAQELLRTLREVLDER